MAHESREQVRIFHPGCGQHHLAEVRLDPTGYPIVRWLKPCQSRLAGAVDKLGEAAGQAFAVAVARGDFWAAEGFAGAALDRNDPEEDRS